MTTIGILCCLFFSVFLEAISISVGHEGIINLHRAPYNDEKIELLQSNVEILNSKIALLEKRLTIAKDLVSQLYGECYNKSTPRKATENFELLKKTQKKTIIDLSEVKNKISNLSILLRESMSEVEDNESNDDFNPKMHLPSSCAEATATNSFRDDSYILYLPYAKLQPFYAYCIHENVNTKAWTIIQRREDGSENFKRNWLDYKQGFGDPYGEYWIGLERLHAITVNQPHELWISLRAFDDTARSAKYSVFSVGSEKEGYKLTVNKFSGDVSDSFGEHNNAKFSTFDKNNGVGGRNCARTFKGGWWYNNCYFCNLNGVYYSFANKNTGSGINWNSWLGSNSSLKYTHMAIRPLS